jgi:hypothetical protein
MPGVGGSLGQCAFCGETFLGEILLGRKVQSFTVSASSTTLYAHKKCLAQYGKGPFDVSALPAKSPLRLSVERAIEEHANQNKKGSDDEVTQS